MPFAYPHLLAALVLVPVLGLLGAFLHARREKALARLTPNPKPQPLAGVQAILFLTGLTLCLLAAARPQWGRQTGPVLRARRNVVVALDVSRSMLAADVRPNRLDRAKTDIADLIDALATTDGEGKTVNDRCALVAFRQDARMICPLTDDRLFLKQTLEGVDIDSAAAGATSLGAGIERALSLIGEEDDAEGKADHSAIILISDGGDLEGQALACADRAKARGVPIFTVGIGDPDKATTVTLPDGKLLREGGTSGAPVKVKLESETLRTIAERSGGRYLPFATAQTAETSLGVIYRDFVRQVAMKVQNEEELRRGERYQWFLVPGLACLLIGAMLSRGRFRSNRKRR